MNILKNPKNRICSIVSLDESSKLIEDRILDLSRKSDIYIIFTKRFSKSININSYCHLLPIHGYLVDDKDIINRTYPFMNVFRYLIEVVKYYSLFFIDNDKSVDIDNIYKIYLSRLDRSVMRSSIISHEFRESLYSKENMSLIRKLFCNKNKGYEGMNITHETSDILLNLPTLLDLIKNIPENKSYISTFHNTPINYSIPSILERFEIHYMNSLINEVKV